MIFVSVAQATTRLGIDAKTLHRWLAEAQLPLQRHPGDGRKKGVSSEDLQTLARLHQRSLAPEALAVPPLPAALLALPERLDTMQAQLAALEQQVAALTHLLQPFTCQPVSPPPAAKPPKTTRRPPTSAAPRSRSAPTGPPKSVHVIPRVEYGEQGHYVVLCPKRGVLPFEPDTQEWFAWVAEQDSFRFVGKAGHFTAHPEGRVPRGAWRAYRHIRHRLYIQRLAKSHELTIAVLEQAAAELQAHLT